MVIEIDNDTQAVGFEACRSLSGYKTLFRYIFQNSVTPVPRFNSKLSNGVNPIKIAIFGGKISVSEVISSNFC